MQLPRIPLSAGVTWNIRKSPRFNTVTQSPVSGARPVSFSVSPFPSWEWELAWEVLRDQGLSQATGLEVEDVFNSYADMKPDFFALQDFYLAMNGSNGRFIYDPAANQPAMEDTFVTERTSGTLVNGFSGYTNGGETVFQLYRTSRVTGSVLPVEAIDALSLESQPTGDYPFALFLDGTVVSTADYTFSEFPLQVTFAVAPAAGKALSWYGCYAYVAKFIDDKIDFNQFMKNLWDLQSLKLEQVPLGF